VEIINDYIALERLRFGHRLNLRFDVQDSLDSQSIAPLILLPLVENAFKHGAGESTTDPFISIKLEIKDGKMHFTVKNNVQVVNKPIEEGVGFTNLKRQLSLLYPDHVFTANHLNNFFTVHLQLPVSNEKD
jgi:LytS/YehU family sensor histidine kinase